MALYTYTQPGASTGFITNSQGTQAADEYKLVINPLSNILPYGKWIINDNYPAGVNDLVNIEVTVNANGNYSGPNPGFLQVTDTGKLSIGFVDARSTPLSIEFNGFNPGQDLARFTIKNAAGQTLDAITSNFQVSTTKSNSGIYDYIYGTGLLSNGQIDWITFDVSNVTNSIATDLTQFGSNEIDFIFSKSAFSSNQTLQIQDSLNQPKELTFFLSASSLSAQNISLSLVSGDSYRDEVLYSDRGLDATGKYGYVSDVSSLSSPLQMRVSADAVTVRRDVPGSDVIDNFVGIDEFTLTTQSDVVDIDTSQFLTSAPQGQWGDWRTLNLKTLGGADTINFRQEVAGVLPAAPDGKRYVDLNSIYLNIAQPWNTYDEKNGVFVNLTGQYQFANIKPTNENIGLASYTSTSSNPSSVIATGQYYDVFGSIDTINFYAGSSIDQVGFETSSYSDRLYLGDEGLGGAIGEYFIGASCGNDVIRFIDETIAPQNDTASLNLSYAWYHTDIQDGLNDVSPVPVKYYSGVIQKGDKGVYGIDRIQRQKNAFLDSELYQLTDTNDYVEFVTASDVQNVTFQLRAGQDRVYLKPQLNDLNTELHIDLSEVSDGLAQSHIKDLIEIDLSDILAQSASQVASNTARIILINVEQEDQISFVNPSSGMTQSVNDGNNGWTFTKTTGSGQSSKTQTVIIELQASSVTALTANTKTVESRTVYDYPTYAMTSGADNAILFEDAGYNSFHNFLAGDDFVVLRDGNLDVVLGAGDDFAGISSNVGEAIVIGGTGNDQVGLYGLIGTGGAASDWVFTTMDVATARQVFADKYALNATTNPFEIELSASGLEVVTVAQRYEGGTTYANGKYTGVGNLMQTVYLQAETVSSVDSGDVSVDSLYGSRDFSVTLGTTAVTNNYYGRRGTEDSLTITLNSADDVAKALTNLNLWMKTSAASQATLNGSVLSGSHVTTLTTSAMGITGATSTYNLVDVERITLTGGGETATIRLAGVNGYVGGNGYTSVQDAVSHANYGDIIYVAKTVETATGSTATLMGSVANQTTIDIPAGLGIVFEPVATTTAYKINLTDQMVYGASAGADRTLQLLGKENIEVAGSTLADVIIGNQGNNIIYGGGGNDVIYGGGGNDTLFGQSGADTLIGSVGNDFLNGGTGDDTLITYGTTRTAATTSDRTNMIGGSGDDQFVFLGGKGQHTLYGGSGEDDYMILPSWLSGTVTTGTVAAQQAVNGVSKVLDFSTVSDDVEGPTAGSINPDAFVAMYNLTFNQLVSPPNPFAASYASAAMPNTSGLAANADWLDIAGVSQNVGDVLENYGLFNDVNEYKLHQGVAA